MMRPLSIRFGLHDLNSGFDVSDSRSLFIHSTHGVGHELGQTGRNGPSIFPVTSLGMSVAWQPIASWRVLAAVLDGVPGDPDDPTRTRIHLSNEEGALGITEAQWSGGRVTKLSIGHWRYTAEFADVRSTQNSPLPERNDNIGSYVALEFARRGSRSAGEPAALAFVRYGMANGRINEFDDFLGIGARWRGVIAARPDDELGLAFSTAGVSAATRSAAIASGARRDAYEAAIEFTFRATINDWLTIQPDIQYIFNPGADPSLPDSLAFGMRFEFSAGTAR